MVDEALDFLNAVRTGAVDLVERAVELGVDVNASYYGYTPLQCSILAGSLEVAQLLLQRGAEVNAVDEEGRTPLFLAVEKGQIDMFRLLLCSGADLDSLNFNYEGKTAVELCPNQKDRETIHHILKVRENSHLCCRTPCPPYLLCRGCL